MTVVRTTMVEVRLGSNLDERSETMGSDSTAVGGFRSVWEYRETSRRSGTGFFPSRGQEESRSEGRGWGKRDSGVHFQGVVIEGIDTVKFAFEPAGLQEHIGGVGLGERLTTIGVGLDTVGVALEEGGKKWTHQGGNKESG